MNTATAVCLTAVIGGSASLALGLVAVTRTFSRRAPFIKKMTPPTSLLIASSSSSSSLSPLHDMTVAELKLQLKDQGLPVSGTKAILIQRLENLSSSEQSSALPAISNKEKSKYFTTTTTTTTNEPTTDVLPMTPMKQQTSPSSVTPEGKKITSSKYFNATKRAPSPSTKGEATTSPRKRIKIVPGSLTPPQHDWERIYNLVKELRSDKTAPCDTDGGEALPEKHLGQKVYRYQVLTALMLSSQTKDAIVGEAMRALQKHGLTVENIHNNTDDMILNQLIGRVGFHNNKTRFIKQVADILVSRYNGDIPPNADEMIALPGVGPKMAYIVESIVYGTSSGIGVDTHMHRMFNDLKWVKSSAPEQTREQLEGWLPKEKWGEVNLLWVGFGQEVQQQKEKILRKVLQCSTPKEGIALLKRLHFDVSKEAKRFGLEMDLEKAMKN